MYAYLDVFGFTRKKKEIIFNFIILNMISSPTLFYSSESNHCNEINHHIVISYFMLNICTAYSHYKVSSHVILLFLWRLAHKFILHNRINALLSDGFSGIFPCISQNIKFKVSANVWEVQHLL